MPAENDKASRPRGAGRLDVTLSSTRPRNGDQIASEALSEAAESQPLHSQSSQPQAGPQQQGASAATDVSSAAQHEAVAQHAPSPGHVTPQTQSSHAQLSPQQQGPSFEAVEGTRRPAMARAALSPSNAITRIILGSPCEGPTVSEADAAKRNWNHP